ncbi:MULTISPECIES: hypothetical protein [Myroides]|uniref:DUF4303 domain-containing protein n=1 Tax=Myroides albus TaxID=2562892 RepID=A0A6I3LDF4_9FLAO|nr:MULTISPECIES: hypothetical protein [Myroides]MTG96558.1 hypothetical protein [Myroides albus]MVX34554.1 hypothetical protein [Myroides sp. LoEW2-1]UVD81028.1 hypothetical protein NWE55_07210 [Myroides albus]
MDRAKLYTYLFKKVERAIAAIANEKMEDIYALSFWKDNDNDDPRCPVIYISYNTASQVIAEQNNASDTMEAKWNFAFWLQDEIETLGGEDNVLQQFIKDSGWYYTDDEQEEAEDLEEEGDDTAYRAICAKDEQVQKAFMEVIISIVQELHQSNLLKEKLGKDIPVIIHELEYYDLPLSWTKQANPPYLIEEFLTYYK